MKLAPDYDRPIAESINVLADSGIIDFPVNLKKIQKAYKNLFVVCPYSEVMAALDISRESCIDYFGSDDGATVASKYGTYIIYYNEVKSRERYRFTIAHEMGHIFMGHFDSCGTSLGLNFKMNNDEYQYLENEANCFARNLLCPVWHVLKVFGEHGIKKYLEGSRYVWREDTGAKTATTENLRTYFSPERLLTENFDVSEQAARTRIGLLSTDSTHSASRACSANYNLIKNIKLNAHWVCSYCGAERIPGALYCVECGEKGYFTYTRGKMRNSYRHGIKARDGKYEVCPVCGNTGISPNASFCCICGTELINRCTRYGHANHPEARYCNTCGSRTFYESRKLVDIVRATLCKEEYGTFYNDGPKLDANKRALNCPRCGYVEFSLQTNFCRSCGLPLYNYCVEVSPPDDYVGPEIIPHKNAGNARFCEFCGQITEYYNAGLLRNWTEIKRNR